MKFQFIIVLVFVSLSLIENKHFEFDLPDNEFDCDTLLSDEGDIEENELQNIVEEYGLQEEYTARQESHQQCFDFLIKLLINIENEMTDVETVSSQPGKFLHNLKRSFKENYHKNNKHSSFKTKLFRYTKII